MSKSKQMRGSSRRVAGPKNSTLSWSPDETSQRLGFRLVSDTETNNIRGTARDYQATVTPLVDRWRFPNTAATPSLGFRLAREDT